LHKLCDYAISHLEQDQVYAKGYAWIFKLAAMQVSGKYSEAKELVAQETNSSASTINAHLLLIINYIEWLEADFYALSISSKHLTDIGIRQGNQEAIANGNHFHGICYYMINNIDLAQYYLKKSYEKRHHTIGVIKLMNSVALAFCHLATNDFSQAESIILEAKNEIRNKNSLYFNTMLEAAHAEIHIATNNIKMALKMLEGVDALPIVPFSNFYVPQYTYVKALINADEKALLGLVQKLLIKYLTLCKETNNHLFELKFKALQAIYLFKHHRDKDAFEIIDFLMKATEVTRAVGIFIDAGSLMMKLLLKYELRAPKNTYVREVINAFSLTGDQDLFSRREMDVLPLLFQSNKEIAETLFIAEKTVKRHVNGIFKKLRVKNRREALQKAIELKLV
jgi:LuxR family maltose regulon positive regulatory protein